MFKHIGEMTVGEVAQGMFEFYKEIGWVFLTGLIISNIVMWLLGIK